MNQLESKHPYHEMIKEVEDFPINGVKFYDIAPLIGNGAVFGDLIEEMSEKYRDDATKIISFDARGFIFGAAMAARLNVGCVMLRKPGKLPGDVENVKYQLEYGFNELEIQSDVISHEDRIVLVDDVLATGGTAMAGLELVQRFGSSVIEFCSLIDLPHLGGSEKLKEQGINVRSLIVLGQEQ
jgi:adenine phosphoribosyltransferase